MNMGPINMMMKPPFPSPQDVMNPMNMGNNNLMKYNNINIKKPNQKEKKKKIKIK